MKLLLDEQLSPEIARRLRSRGHDVVAVCEQPELRGRPDHVHFASLPGEQRAIVTRDLGDFRPLIAGALRAGQPTYGLICVSRRFPLSRQGVGRLVDALDSLLKSNPAPDAAIKLGGEIWLSDAADR